MIIRTATVSASDKEAVVAELVEQYLQRIQAGEAIDPRTFAAENLEYAEALCDVLPAVAALAGLESLGTSTLPRRDEICEFESLGEFIIKREVGRGGMGVVYEAEQASLGRRVALKILPFGAARDPRQRARFQVEAHAVASLNHPSIVPIFAVGSDQGVHFYAMQFIEGRSLAEVIADLRTREPQGAGATGLPPMEVARLGLEAADAIGHAHAMGILHRDIKPANMLMDGKGHLWIVDFGLARFEAGSDLTHTGDMFGTLRYMSPEQALARGMLGPRSDVYSLGVSLYEMLVLRPAFDGRDRQQLLKQIADDEPISPRKLDRRIPRDLETIVLKAIVKEPEGRYASAEELAHDLKRFLEGVPILSRRPRPAERFGRWMRRHKAAVAMASGVILLAVIGLAAGNFMLWKEKGRTNENLELALSALDALHGYLGEEGLNTNPEQAESIRKTLQSDLALYTRLAGQNAQNQAARWGAARAHRRMGDIEGRSAAKLDAALAAYRVADTLLVQLLSQDPSNLQYRDERARVLGHWGKLVYLAGGSRVFRGSLAAEGPLRRALDIDRDLLAGHPGEARYQRRYLENAFYLIGVLFIAERPDEREQLLTQAKAILRDVPPGAPSDRLDLAVIYKLLGDMMHATCRSEEGADAYGRSIAILESLIDEPLADQAFRRSIVDVFGRLGQLSFCSTSQPVKELEFYARAVPVWDRLIDRYDLTPGDRFTRSHAYRYLGYLFAYNNRDAEAVAPQLRAVELGEALLKIHPGVVAYRQELASNSQILGRLLMTTGRPREALRHFNRSIELLPESAGLKNLIVWSLVIYPNPFAARSVELAGQLISEHPDKPEYWSRLGAAHIRAGDWARGLEWLDRVIRTGGGGDLDDWLFMAMAAWHRGDRASARRWYDKAADVLDDSTKRRDPAIDHLWSEVAALMGLRTRPLNSDGPPSGRL